ncbi:UNVERIFIED_CONTAM: hypothetical protein FKN15_003863 [Acipenser sinensis]
MATYSIMSNGSEVGSEDFDTSDSDANLSLSDYDEDDVVPRTNRRACSYFTGSPLRQYLKEMMSNASQYHSTKLDMLTVSLQHLIST